MAWKPESFSQNERHAAAKTVVQAQVMLDRLNRSEFGLENVELVQKAYLRIDDMLAMLHESLYNLDELNSHPPSS
ncbi:Uncharacterised protein [Mycolicibacterium flavescens]|uniref:hypothetical protein n=1 Tax=Mycobacterium neumannii TaxID=2048551 RepID=UPI000B942A50|nr:hypothetical protein [Mycobacterium neumannii]VEG42737.1 Uncharacterised protein [Mycolicibacterium flavescens]